MERADWLRLNELLDEVIELAPDERHGWLAQLGPGDEPLKARLAAMLAPGSPDDSASLLGTIPKIDTTGGLDANAATDHAGAIVGPYRLLRELGEGGRRGCAGPLAPARDRC